MFLFIAAGAVGLNGARLTVGHSASVALDDGSTDAAFQVVFGPPAQTARRE